GAGYLRRVAAEEVVHRLLGREARDGRQDAEGVGGEEHDVVRVPAHAGGRGVRHVLDRVGGARVLGLRVGGEVDLPGHGVDDDVLEDGPEAVAGREDLGL